MFESNFNFNNEKETISEEIRKLLSQAKTTTQCSSDEESSYLAIWKKNLLKLSGNN